MPVMVGNMHGRESGGALMSLGHWVGYCGNKILAELDRWSGSTWLSLCSCDWNPAVFFGFSFT